MDRPLDEIIASRQRRGHREGRDKGWQSGEPRRTEPKKQWNVRSEPTDIDTDWVHDKYDDDPDARPVQDRSHRNSRPERRASPPDIIPNARLRVDNLHYELTEDDLQGLFKRIAPVTSLSLRFDRAGRSTGTAYVTYQSVSAAKRAIDEFDGANAAGQPIHLTLMPSAPPRNETGRLSYHDSAARNPFDTAVKPGLSLFDRVEDPNARRRYNDRSRSRSPNRFRRGDNSSRPAREAVDRYIPSHRRSARSRSRSRSRSRTPPRAARRRRSPLPRGGRDRRRGGDRVIAADDRGQRTANGRPRKTQEDLDKEMDDYWGGNKEEVNGHANGNGNRNAGAGVPPLAAATTAAAADIVDEDIDMIS